MATFDSGGQRYSMNFYASHQRPLQRRSYTGRPSRPAEGQLRVKGRKPQRLRILVCVAAPQDEVAEIKKGPGVAARTW